MKTLPLRFTPHAWAHYVTIRDAADTEVGAYGVTDEDDPLLVTALLIPKQTVTVASVEVDGDALLDMAEAMDKQGYPPHRWSRVWCHTHPGDSAEPSGVDEVYFESLDQEWSAMVILADGGESYCRFSWNPKHGAAGEAESYLEVDYTQPFAKSRHEKWLENYKAQVTKRVFTPISTPTHYNRPWYAGQEMGKEDTADTSEDTAEDPFANMEEYCCEDCNGAFIVDYDDMDAVTDDWDALTKCPYCTSLRTLPAEGKQYDTTS